MVITTNFTHATAILALTEAGTSGRNALGTRSVAIWLSYAMGVTMGCGTPLDTVGGSRVGG
ncbi:hypothetical protein CCR75_003721 [Bremia lactucae]|uniref:Uncharacterized protein n=1 Tax=Bremia lactucae TaxID=4779 RepID=A0A976IJQ0_BRELC|nr:hypothetical protein CCR75_003721 [Bremia lactucae]